MIAKSIHFPKHFLAVTGQCKYYSMSGKFTLDSDSLLLFWMKHLAGCVSKSSCSFYILFQVLWGYRASQRQRFKVSLQEGWKEAHPYHQWGYTGWHWNVPCMDKWRAYQRRAGSGRYHWKILYFNYIFISFCVIVEFIKHSKY